MPATAQDARLVSKPVLIVTSRTSEARTIEEQGVHHGEGVGAEAAEGAKRHGSERAEELGKEGCAQVPVVMPLDAATSSRMVRQRRKNVLCVG